MRTVDSAASRCSVIKTDVAIAIRTTAVDHRPPSSNQ